MARFQISKLGDKFQVAVRPSSINWFAVNLTRDEATQLMTGLMALLLQHDKPKS